MAIPSASNSAGSGNPRKTDDAGLAQQLEKFADGGSFYVLKAVSKLHGTSLVAKGSDKNICGAGSRRGVEPWVKLSLIHKLRTPIRKTTCTDLDASFFATVKLPAMSQTTQALDQNAA
jgi:hypothetical protein